MNTIVFYSEKGVPKEYAAIVEALTATKQSINIIFTDSLKNIDTKNIVLILFTSIRHSAIKHLDASTRIIVNSINQRSIKTLAHCKHSVYTCGFSSKDYITFSSKFGLTAVVSLQRNIRPLDNMMYEPFEISCTLKSSYSDFTILSCVLAMILLNLVDERTLKPIEI